MEDHIPIRPDRSLLLGRQTSKWSLWDVVVHENTETDKEVYRRELLNQPMIARLLVCSTSVATKIENGPKMNTKNLH